MGQSLSTQAGYKGRFVFGRKPANCNSSGFEEVEQHRRLQYCCPDWNFDKLYFERSLKLTQGRADVGQPGHWSDSFSFSAL
jgi:hypothetical protein